MTQIGRHSSVSPYIMLQHLLTLYGKSPKNPSELCESLNCYYI